MKILSYRKNEKDKFELLCEQWFRYLETDFSFKGPFVTHNSHGTYLVYKNLTTAVKISFGFYDGYIYVDIVRLADKKIPEYPIFIKSDTLLKEYDLFDIITLREPSYELIIPPFSEWSNEEVIKKDIQLRAELLKTYASDILRGDFSIFPELEKIVKARAKKLNEEEEKEVK